MPVRHFDLHFCNVLHNGEGWWVGGVHIPSQGWAYLSGRFENKRALRDHLMMFTATSGERLWRHVFPRIDTSTPWEEWNPVPPPPRHLFH